MSPRELPPTSAFAHDDGSADPVLTELLAAYAEGRSSLADVVRGLAGTRLLVPVLAHAEVSAEPAAAAHAAGMRCIAVPYVAEQADEPGFTTADLLLRGGQKEFTARSAYAWLRGTVTTSSA